jgi:hypothetical protein
MASNIEELLCQLETLDALGAEREAVEQQTHYMLKSVDVLQDITFSAE